MFTKLLVISNIIKLFARNHIFYTFSCILNLENEEFINANMCVFLYIWACAKTFVCVWLYWYIISISLYMTMGNLFAKLVLIKNNTYIHSTTKFSLFSQELYQRYFVRATLQFVRATVWYIYIYVCIFAYIYIYMCVCVLMYIYMI